MLFNSNRDNLRDIEVNSIKISIENIKKDIENIKTELKKIDLKYMNWLEEKEIWIKDLRDKIQKKVDYMNKRQDDFSLKEALARKVFGRKSLNSSVPV